VIEGLPCAGATHVISTLLPEILVVGAAGTLGAVTNAPLPSIEYDELLTTFLACTFAIPIYPAPRL
jgi:hypothetical protein